MSQLHSPDADSAYPYGAPGSPGGGGDLGGLNAFFLLTDEPEVYNLPAAPERGSNRNLPSLTTGLVAAAGLALAAAALFGGRRDG